MREVLIEEARKGVVGKLRREEKEGEPWEGVEVKKKLM